MVDDEPSYRFLDADVAYVGPEGDESLPAFLRRAADAIEQINTARAPESVSHMMLDYTEERWAAVLVIE